MKTQKILTGWPVFSLAVGATILLADANVLVVIGKVTLMVVVVGARKRVLQGGEKKSGLELTREETL